MDLTIWPLTLLSLAEIATLSALARFRSVDMVGRAMHPYNILGFLFAVINVDFLSLYGLISAGHQTYFAETMLSNMDQVKQGFVFFVLCQTFMLVGIALIPTLGQATFQKGIRGSEVRAARICMILCVIGTLIGGWNLILVSLQHGSFTYIAGVRQRFFAANPMLLIIVSTVAPAYILFGSRNSFRSAVWFIVPLIPFLILVGGRSKLLYPGIALAYWYCQRRRASPAWIYVMAPLLLGGLTLFTFLSRENGSLGDFAQYLDQNGGVTGPLFDGDSISMAEVITINVTRPVLERSPWESWVGAAMLPIPRALVPQKPLGASTQFSMTIDPDRWELVKSEWTVTGFVNLLYDYGYIGALFASLILGMAWALIIQLAARSRFGTSFVGPVCCLVAYQFIRGDIYIVSQFIWPMVFVIIIYKAALILSSLTAPRPRRAPSVAQDKTI